MRGWPGGTITARFDQPSTVVAIDFLDTEEPGGTIELFGEHFEGFRVHSWVAHNGWILLHGQARKIVLVKGSLPLIGRLVPCSLWQGCIGFGSWPWLRCHFSCIAEGACFAGGRIAWSKPLLLVSTTRQHRGCCE